MGQCGYPHGRIRVRPDLDVSMGLVLSFTSGNRASGPARVSLTGSSSDAHEFLVPTKRLVPANRIVFTNGRHLWAASFCVAWD